MSDVNDYLYPEDPTGSAATNLVPAEVHTLVPPTGDGTFHFIIPDATPYFADTLHIRHTASNQLLVRGQDWIPCMKFDSATFETESVKGGIYAGVLFYNKQLAGQISLEPYQTLGGGWTLNESKILELLDNNLLDPRTYYYEQVSGKPTVFPPLDHTHPITDTTSYADSVEAYEDIAQAIREQTQAWLDNPPLLPDQYYLKVEIDSMLEAITNQFGNYLTQAQISDLITQRLMDYYTRGAIDQIVADLRAEIQSSTGGVTEAWVNQQLTAYVKKTDLGDYVTEEELNQALLGFVSDSELATTLQNYVTGAALSQALQGYVTSGQLSSALQNYVTSSALATALNNYVTSTHLTTNYSTTQQMNQAIVQALSSYSTTQQMNAAISMALAGYPTTQQMNQAIASSLQNYSTTTQMNQAISTALQGYVTQNSLTTTLANYVTGATLNATLEDYVSNSALAQALAGFVKEMTIETVTVANRTLVAADHRKRLRSTAGTVYTISPGIVGDFYVEIEQAGNDRVSVVGGANVTISADGNATTKRKGSVIKIRRTGTNLYNVYDGQGVKPTWWMSSTPGTYTIELEAGVYSVLGIGGGGGGSNGGTLDVPTTAAGGGSGYPDKKRITVPDGARLVVTVGAGAPVNNTSQTAFGGASTVRLESSATLLVNAAGGQSGYFNGTNGAIGGRGCSGGGSGGGRYTEGSTNWWCTAGDGGKDGGDGGDAIRQHGNFPVERFAGGAGAGDTGSYTVVNASIDPLIDHGAPDFRVPISVDTGGPEFTNYRYQGKGGVGFWTNPGTGGGSGGGGGGGFTPHPKRSATSRNGNGYGAGGGAGRPGIAGLVSIIRVSDLNDRNEQMIPANNGHEILASGRIEIWGQVRIGNSFNDRRDYRVEFPRKIARLLNFTFSKFDFDDPRPDLWGETIRGMTITDWDEDGFSLNFMETVGGIQNFGIFYRIIAIPM